MTQVLITGASRGIGRACASRFADAGCELALVARGEAALLQVRKELLHEFPARIIHCIPADLSQATGCEQVVLAMAKKTFAPDVLINNAGRFAMGGLVDESEEQLASLLNLNMLASYRLGRALIPEMITRGNGHIISIGSVACQDFPPGMGQYTLSKLALHALHEVWARELTDSPIRGSLIAPGPTRTSSWDNSEFLPDKMLTPEAVAECVFTAYSAPPTDQRWTTTYLRP